jgi:hypothetical protein
VSGELPPCAIPTAIPLGFWIETGALAKIGKHALRLKVEEILRIEVLRTLQRTAGQPHTAQRQRDSLKLNLMRKTRGSSSREREHLQKRANKKYWNTKPSHTTSRGP